MCAAQWIFGDWIGEKRMKSWSRPAAAAFLASCALAHAAGESHDSTRIEFFSPQGTVKDIRQVSVRFTSPMVALGDPRLPDPFKIDCPASGKGRWADGRNWIYDFDSDLPAGVSCRFTPRSELRALDGSTVSGDEAYAFNTGGPAVVASFPHEGWEEIDEDQVFLLKLDAPATTETIETNAHCVIEGITEQVPVQVLRGEARDAILKARADLGYDYFRLLWKDGEETHARVRNRTMENAEDAIVALKCQRRMPPATEMALVWGKGIATDSGIATSEDQKLAFRIRPAFTAQVSCTRSNAHAGCIPLLPITVSFTSPVPRTKALAIRLKTTDGHVLKPETTSAKEVPSLGNITFKGPFPGKSSVSVALPDEFIDDAGRALENAARFPLKVQVDEYPPLAKFSGYFGILEAGEGGVLPVTVRNLEAELQVHQSAMPGKSLRLDNDPTVIADWMRRVERSDERKGKWVKLSPEEIEARRAKDNTNRFDEAWQDETGTQSIFGTQDNTTAFSLPTSGPKKPAEVIGIPLKEPGFYVVELESRLLGTALLGRDETRYVDTVALVTNLAVHFKWGREASRVWVTQLDTGKPVGDAEVTITDFCQGNQRWQGRTGPDGIAVVDQSLGEPRSNSQCSNYWPDPLFVTAKKDHDFSFTQSGWNQGIAPSEFSLRTGNVRRSEVYHTVLDRPLFRAGETVSMKHYLRRNTMQGVVMLNTAPHTRTVQILHSGSGQQYDIEASFDAQGVAETQWKIPEEAKLGEYEVSIDDDEGGRRHTAQFRVEQFRLPSMHASISGSARPLINAKNANLDVHVAYLSGGGASGMPVKIRTLVEPLELKFPDYADYQFGGASVQEGVTTSAGTYNDYDFEAGTDDVAASKAKAQVTPVTLDGTGAARVTIPDLPKLDSPASLNAELEYADANGEILTASGRVRLLPSALNVGIRREGWAASAAQMRFRVLVLDLDGKPHAQQPVTASLYQTSNFSYRKRVIGGFYTYETTKQTRKLAMTCAGATDVHGLLLCEVAPGVSGEILIRAETKDAQGHIAGATASVWVAGKDDWWFGGTAGDRMDLIPEKKEYESGDTARFQVRMPFRSATALVTVEREGVMSSFVTHLDGRAPVVEVPIKNTYAPNVFVSVLAVRGRVEHAEGSKQKGGVDAEITALVDLNKPAYRLGLAEIQVGWKPHRLDVRVTPERKTYQVRDKANVQVHVDSADGAALPAGAEVALVAVDEALLELAANPSWALLDAMMGKRGLEVLTSTAQMQVVGKRHYGRKAVPHGGGGGRESAREQFDSLLFWKARITLDAHGDATVSVPLNDSLSSFRIVAIAHSGPDHFGTGTANIATAQDLILVSGLPPLVREGDRYAATFTLRNTSARAIAADVTATLNPSPEKSLAPQHIDVPGGEARDLIWQVDAPVGSPKLQWEVAARETATAAADKIKITEMVIPAFPVRTYQATIAQLDRPLTIPAQRPAGSVPGRGGLEITLREKLGDGLDGVREYMSAYPYICLEQNISRAVALGDRELWDDWMRRLPAYMDRDGLLKYFQSERLEGDDTLTAYVLAIGAEAGWPIPDAEKTRLIEALTGFVKGQIVRDSALPTVDLAIRKLAAIDALSRYKAADPAMLDSIVIEPNLWPTSALLDWLGILNRVDGIAQAQERREAALVALRARLNFQGTIMTFSTERSDALWWLMISSDSNANRMLLAVLDLPEWREDIPRVVRGALGRQQHGHWNTTVANAWGALAMEKFSAAFESTPVTGDTKIHYQTNEKSFAWEQSNGSTQIDLPWAEGLADLSVTHAGSGKPWAMVRATAALPLDQPLSSGYKIARTIIPVERHAEDRWTRGDVIRVKLDLEAQTDMSWVVVDDPIPAGATILGSGLGGQSTMLDRTDLQDGWAWLAFEERRFDAFRAYYRLVPKGHWSVEYTVRLNNPGAFLLPATRVEAMYAPEMFGEMPNATMTVVAAGQ
jgi:uncharacterized protein YfaS (alpha-2-macroglobulin family)